MTTVAELFARRDAQWKAVKDHPRLVAMLRRSYADAGWKLCPHDTCPPYDCQER